MKPKIIFVHGMFLNPKCWENWITYFEERGFQCEAPAWPFHDGEPSFLRENVPWELSTLGLSTVLGFYENHLRRRGEFPVIIGHSLGGLIVQRLVASGLASAGVCLAPVPPNKMLSLDRGLWKNTVGASSDDPCNMTPDLFQTNFCNGMSAGESQVAFDRYAAPESRQLLRDISGANGMVDVDCPHVPLLFVAGGKDTVVPAAVVKRNASAYTDSRSLHDYVELPGRGHFLLAEDGWEAVSRRATDWIDAHLAIAR